jgi:hypothetical protein
MAQNWYYVALLKMFQIYPPAADRKLTTNTSD